MVLHSIRESATGWFAWVIVILISIPFALWGINSYITPDSNPAIAHVGDYKVTVQEFNNAVQNESKELKGKLDDALIKQVVIEKLVNNRALINFLSDSGMSISKGQVDAAIRQDPSFQLEGQFSSDLYNRYLPNAYSKSNYRNSMATNLLLEQFSEGINQSAFVTDNEVQHALKLINQKRDISYSIIHAKDFSDKVTISDEEINAYYQNFASQFSNPEQIKLAYLEISRDEMAKNIHVSDEQIEQYYQDNLTQYTQPERRKASHILFLIENDVNDADKKTVKEKAQSVLDKINSGADFATMAKEYSEDSGSAENGGDLGFFGREEMVPAFEDSAYSLNVDEVSALVESSFGYHIIKLTAIEGGTVKPKDTIKEEIVKSIQFDEVENAYFEKVEAMQTIAYEQPDSLEPVATELNLKIQESELITRTGTKEGLFSHPKLLNIAFSESVLEEGNNSDTIELGNEHVAVIHLVERIPANTKPLEEVKDLIETRLKQDSLTEKAQEQANNLSKQINDGKSFDELSQEHSLIVENSGAVERQDQTVLPEILHKAFTMPRKMTVTTEKMRNGDIVIIVINSIEEGDGSKEQPLFESVKSALIRNKANMETSLSVLQIRSESVIDINTKILNEKE